MSQCLDARESFRICRLGSAGRANLIDSAGRRCWMSQASRASLDGRFGCDKVPCVIPPLIVVTGAAATGKSTLARALQIELVRKGDFWHVLPVDLFARGLSLAWFSFRSHQGRFADRGFVYGRGEGDGVDLRLGPDARRLLAAFHRSVAAVVQSGLQVICEGIVYDEEDWLDWCQAVAGIPTFWIRLSAPLAVLEAREQGDRTRIFRGLARGMNSRAVSGKYDLEADTSVEAAQAIVYRILRALRSEQR